MYKGSSAAVRNDSNAAERNNSNAAMHNDSSAVVHNDSSAAERNDSSAVVHNDSSVAERNDSSTAVHNDSSAAERNDSSAVVHNDSSAAVHDDSSALEAAIYAENQSNNPGVSEAQELGRALLMAGYLRQINFINEVDLCCPKLGQHHVTHGEVAAMATCLIGAGLYKSQSAASKFIRTHNEILAMLGIEQTKACYFTRDIIGETLAALWKADCLSQLYSKFALRGGNYLGLLEEITKLTIDSTNDVSWKSKSQDGKDGMIKIVHGKSKVHRNDLRQYSTVGISSPQFGALLALSVEDGNVSDIKAFPNLLMRKLPQLVEDFPNVQFISGDSKLYSPWSFSLSQYYGLHVVTRAPDLLKYVKDALKDLSGMEPVYSEDEFANDRRKHRHMPHYKWINAPTIALRAKDIPEDAPDELRQLVGQTTSLKALMVKNPSLLATKTRTLTKEAEEELKELESKCRQKHMCGNDAEAAVNRAKKSAKYCTVEELGYKVEFKRARRGKPSKDKTKNDYKISTVQPIVEVRIDAERLDRLIKSDCVYVIVTTDVERDWTPRELLELYHGNSVIEEYWRTSKDGELLLPRLWLENEDRIEALVWLQHIACLGLHVIGNKLNQAAEADPLVVPPQHDPSFPESKLTPARVMRYLTVHPIQLQYCLRTKRAFFGSPQSLVVTSTRG